MTTSESEAPARPRCICAELGCAPHQRHTLCPAHDTQTGQVPQGININVKHEQAGVPEWVIAYRLGKSVSWFILFMALMLWLGGKVF